MDSILSSALEEICAQGQSGLSLASLWTKIGIELDIFQKSLVYSNLLKIPSLQFHIPHNTKPKPKPKVKANAKSNIKAETQATAATALVNPNDSSIQSFEEAEKLQLKIVASSGLIDNFLGLYDRSSSAPERRVLERLAISRSNGVTQSQLAKEFGIQGNKFHYTVRSLECKGLIVKQPALVKKNAPGSEGESKNSSHVKTNLIHLHRFAKHLDSQQIFEISKGALSMGSLENENENAVQEDLHIKDYIPAMKAICGKLEGATGKVLFAADIKRELGYSRSSSGKKAWKNISQRLKDAGIIEEFEAEVNRKTVYCVRLLKKFSSKSFESNFVGCGDTELKFGRRSQTTEQLVELPIEHQIYDMVDAEESGILIFEVCDRLGIDLKKNHDRLCSMISKFGMPLQRENYKKTEAYRVWTSRKSYFKFSNSLQSKSLIVDTKNEISYPDIGNPDDVSHKPDQMFIEHDHSTDEGNFANTGVKNDVEFNAETSPDSFRDDKTNYMLPSPAKQELLHKPNGMAAVGELALLSTTMETNISPSETRCHTTPKPLTNSLPSLSPNGLRREQLILERLQVDKFILKAELPRWLAELEGKCNAIDGKSIRRILVRLEHQGHCKVLGITVPAVRNFGHNCIATLVLHSSVQSLTLDLIGEIHDRLRSSEKQINGHGSCSKKNNKSIPVLEGVQRIQSHIDSDGKADRLEAMQANGFEPRKMIRAKLLHSFLWGYLSSSSAWNDLLSSGKHVPDLKDPHSSCCLFSLEAAIMNIPLELFLQVAGSTKKSDDITEKSKRGLCLSDLPTEEYRCLMDTGATERISLIIDILRRLKLIRLVCNGDMDGCLKISHATLKYTVELRPYIEEPPTVAVTSNSTSRGLHRQVRHDFFLSSREAVDEYWQILEHCYAAVDQRAALLAFPGSAVHEVLHMHYDKHQHINRFQGASNANENGCQLLKHKSSSSQKRKKSIGKISVKRARIDVVTGQLGGQSDDKLPDTANKFGEENDLHSLGSQDDEHLENVEVRESNEEDEKGHSTFGQRAVLKMKSSHQKRFLWTDEADRQLVIQYVRYRAARGAKFHSVDWASLPNLPACPMACKRRMSSLRSSERFNKALMKLCNMLSEQYVKHLEKYQNMSLDNGCKVCSSSREGHCHNISNGVEHTEDAGFEEKQWDDFDDRNIERALEDVLRLKQMAKLEASKRVGPAEDCSNNIEESGFVSATTCGDHNLGMRQQKNGLIHQRFFKRSNEGISIDKKVLQSLAVSNAIELLKLVFLSTSTSELPNLLAKTLRCYSKHDLFAAFSYLREKKFMIGGNGKPFVLSQHFLLSLSKSPFPVNTGKRAAKFCSWLYEREKDLREGVTELDADLQCGDFFQLFSLVSAGELSVVPCLPDEGIGEAEDLRWMKRKREDSESCKSSRAKKLKSSLMEGELVSRREKGFPGIMVSVHRAAILMPVELFKDREKCTIEVHKDGGTSFQSDLKESLNFGSIAPVEGSYTESPWEAMAAYAKYLSRPDTKQISSFSPEVFMAVYAAIQKAGDQGLSMKEISQVVDMPGDKVPECIIDVLQAFGQALQVNAYGSVRIVDALYRSKYFLTSMGGFHQDRNTPFSTKFLGGTYNSHLVLPENHDSAGANSGGETKINVNHVHTVTILNQPEDVAAEFLNEAQASDMHEVSMQSDVDLIGNKMGESCESSYSQVRMPILPWVNGDGTVNSIVYDGLIRRVFGLVMQNPAILEDQILHQVDVLNPQSCKKLLELMVLDKHLIVRKMHQTSCSGPPNILKTFLGRRLRNSCMRYREHFFANPMSTSIL